jgi:tricorn protease
LTAEPKSTSNSDGCWIPDFFFERLPAPLRRRLVALPRRGYRSPGAGDPRTEGAAHHEYAGSSGDSLADYFRTYALGPIVGKRTWGGLVGIGNELPMIGHGVVTMPDVAACDVIDGNSTWIVENHGVHPDIEVGNRPDLVIAGRDASPHLGNLYSPSRR